MGFDEQALKQMGSVCLIVGDEFTRLSDALKAFNDAIAAMAVGVDQEKEKWVYDKCDPVADLRRILEEMCAHDKLAELADIAYLAEEPADIPPPRKMPRPPKRTGPVSKANYTANRPPRVARSNCRNIKR